MDINIYSCKLLLQYLRPAGYSWQGGEGDVYLSESGYHIYIIKNK